jgi:nucleotide-binding universal stress UspA family protein
MQRFKRILYVDDGGAANKAALERALTLARRNLAELTVVGILEGMPPELHKIKGLKPADLQEMAIQERREQLETLVAPLRREGMKLTSNILIGTPFLEIIREVLRDHHDLVMLNAEGKKGLKDMIFGSTEMHLMRKCPCPVWVTNQTQLAPYARILAAVDPDPSEIEHSTLNSKIMKLATSLAQRDGNGLPNRDRRIFNWQHRRNGSSSGRLFRSNGQAGRVCDTGQTGERPRRVIIESASLSDFGLPPQLAEAIKQRLRADQERQSLDQWLGCHRLQTIRRMR